MSNYGLSMVSIAGPSKHDCGYCKGKDTSISFGIWAHSMTCADYQDLIDRGWRRSGKYLYKPDLEKSCCPQYTIRLDATKFNMTKNQKKVLHKFNRYVIGNCKAELPAKKPANYVQVKSLQDSIHEPEEQEVNEHKLEIVLEPSSFTKEKFALYAKYQVSIHHDLEEDVSESGFTRFLVDSPLKTNNESDFGSFHQKYTVDGKLIALAVIDILPKCISSVYFMYDPDYSFLGLGKYSAFREICLVQEYNKKFSDLKYYYMGFYIHTCPKMNYKGKYSPSDLLDPVSYKWYPIENFKSKLDETSFVTFDPIERDYPPGWLDPKSLKEKELENVFVLIGDGRIAPIIHIVKFRTSKSFKKNILDYVCSVGLELAHKMIIC
ncbi:arginine-tRNA-protein transferase [Mucor mucedo]|uniref:arginine-tRNA-protein transferase n=1 Tax=Mucor mucedo TaxID=29922 RepID=UPI00221E6EB2|nr:arginine-tRNA-protein transferase [Mucor mucedo]KAI7889687.1 arginine-tRNA-protein transferase [Mucor mucedo]